MSLIQQSFCRVGANPVLWILTSKLLHLARNTVIAVASLILSWFQSLFASCFFPPSLNPLDNGQEPRTETRPTLRASYYTSSVRLPFAHPIPVLKAIVWGTLSSTTAAAAPVPTTKIGTAQYKFICASICLYFLLASNRSLMLCDMAFRRRCQPL